jgi:enoyl-[acyl-carrier-protein] reductase (NADH)
LFNHVLHDNVQSISFKSTSLLLLLLLLPLSSCCQQLYPLKRLATPEDIAWAVCWLVHPKTTFTTGAAIPVDGGLTTCQAVGLAKPAAAAAAK